MAAVPAEAVKLEIAAELNVKVHWIAEGWVPVEVSDKLRFIVPPATPEPEDKLREL